MQYIKDSVEISSVSVYGAKNLETSKLFRFFGRNHLSMQTPENILKPTDIIDVELISESKSGDVENV